VINNLTAPNRLTQAIRDWQLAILRFAITLDSADRAKILLIARELDRLGPDGAATAFAFFTRTSLAFCGAIADKTDPSRGVILRRQLLRIGDTRLRSALEAAVDLGLVEPRIPKPRRYAHGDLWRGLKEPVAAGR
jgi:hypothetical protein